MTERTPSQRGKANRSCGQRHERAVKDKLKELFPEAKRSIQSRGGTADAQDVEGTPFAVECKHQISPNILAALAQADLASYTVTEEGTKLTDPRPPVAITRRKKSKHYQGKDIVTMKFEDWIDLVKKAYS